ncbi:hypothetical protein TNCV_652931 [Trichonephila clavipes]|nr:hypothetical protein TNCV_652931 [Trichonephila clavipes]
MLPLLGKKAVLEWCMKEGLIGSSYVCPKCGKTFQTNVVKLDRGPLQKNELLAPYLFYPSPKCGAASSESDEFDCCDKDYDDDFLQHIVVAETRCHHIQLEVKSVSMQWKHPDSPSPKKFKVQQPAEKVMLTAFFDMQGLLLLELKSAGCLDKCPTVQPNT